MTTKQKRSRSMSIANSLRAKGWDFGRALRQGWRIVRAMEAMQDGGAILRYRKEKTTDGMDEIRHGVSLGAVNYSPTGTGRKPRPDQIVYFDRTKNGVRSFLAANFRSYMPLHAAN